MISEEYFTGSSFYKDLVNNRNQIHALYNIKKKNLKLVFQKLKNGADLFKELDSNHPIIKNDEYLKLIFQLRDLKPEFKQSLETHFENLTFQNLIKLELRMYFILLFVEFEKYLFKCFKYIIKNRPEIIENRTFSIKEIEKYNDIELIRQIAIDKFIHDISYNSLSEIFKKAEKPLGIKHGISEELIKKFSGFREMRNLLIHKDSFIDKHFIDKVERLNLNKVDLGVNTLEIGSKIEITEKMLKDAEKLSFRIACEFDKKFVSIYAI